MSTNMLSVEQFQKVLPPQVKKNVDQDLVDHINKLITDPEERESLGIIC